MAIFSTPRIQRADMGVHEFGVGLGESLGTAASEAFHESPTAELYGIAELQTAKGEREDIGSMIARVQGGEDPADVMTKVAPVDDVPTHEARAQVKEAGLDKTLTLPDAPTIRRGALDIMMERARGRQERAATMARGPQGFTASALSVGTSFLVGALDPVNVAAAFIPVVGEARYAKVLVDAGESAVARAQVRAATGAASGAVGMAAIEPIAALAKTGEGQDYTMAHALRSVIFGAALGGVLHTGGGALADVYRGRQGRPLYPYDIGEPLEFHTPFDELKLPPPGSPQPIGRETPPARLPETFAEAAAQVDRNVSRETSGGEPVRIAAEAPSSAPEAALSVPEGESRAVSPAVAMIDDLPPRAKEDAMRVAITALTEGSPVRSGDIIAAAAQHDPRIAESVHNGDAHATASVAELSPAGRAVFDDMRQQLQAAGMTHEEALANAAIVAARYEARAARLEGAGGTAEDLYRAEGIQVRRGGVDDELGRMYAQRRIEGQGDLPGFGPISEAELAQRRANAPLKPKAAQRPMDEGLFGDTAQQSDLIDSAQGRQLFQPATRPEPFYSAVSRAITSARQERASPEQWLATLRNTPGVKAEEIKWLGIEDWLKEQSGPVSRRDVEDYVRANQIEVKEVEKGGNIAAALEKKWERAADAVNYGIARNLPEGQMGPLRATRDELWARMRRERAGAGETKFSQHTLPGGENYRELLLTLPPKTDAVAARARELAEQENGAGSWSRIGGGGQEHYLQDARRELGRREVESNFRSSHWDEPNVISHIRFNDRTIDGKKTLFIEEVQSDWHQAGKRRGYAQVDPVAKDAAGRAMDKADTELRFAEQKHRLGRGYVTNPTEEIKQLYSPEAISEIKEALDRFRVAREEYRKYDEGTGLVPDAPFKTTWPELAMKRMIRYAAENGYDKVAWTPGEVQAERYDLSKQVQKIEAIKLQDGTYRIDAVDKDGTAIHIATGIDAPQIADHVGKDLAEKIANNPAQKPNAVVGYSGLDLKVGGEGMKGFYDKILPTTVNKLTKKFGGKVEEGKLSNAADEFIARHPETYGEEMAAEHGGREGATVHTLDITPSLRKAAIEEGFPLFQREPRGEMRGRITLADNKAIIDLFSKADRSTFVHETGHLWLDEMARDAGRENAPEGIRTDMDTVLKWLGAERADAITDAQHERFARAFEQYLADGKAPTEGLRGVFEQFKQWLTAIYKAIAGAGEEVAPEIRAVMDRMLATPEQLGERAAEREGAAAPNVVRGPKAAFGPRARPEETWTLFEFLASRGGLRPDADVAAVLGNNPQVFGFGRLVRPGGLPLDRARELAVEAGYIHDAAAREAEHGHVPQSRPTESRIQDLLDALDTQSRGQKVYREGYEPRRGAFDPDEELHALNSEIDALAREGGVEPAAIVGRMRDRIIEIMKREGVHDVDVAYERAVMKETHNGAETGRNERIQDHIPGWDTVPDVGGPAQAPGGPAARLGNAGQPAAGAAPRAGGGLDRQAGQRPAGSGPAAAGQRDASWRAFADTPRDFNEPDVVAASKAAEALPEPASAVPGKRLQAAEKADAEAALRYDAAADYLPADLKGKVEQELRILEQDGLDTAEVLRRGAACLAAGVVGAVA